MLSLLIIEKALRRLYAKETTIFIIQYSDTFGWVISPVDYTVLIFQKSKDSLMNSVNIVSMKNAYTVNIKTSLFK